MTTIYTGLDIAKLNLQLHLLGRRHDLPNTAAGHRRLVKLLAALPGAHVICEATGGYERDLVAALHDARIPVSVLNPARVRHFARATGQRAKTDPLDAAILTAYGQALQPPPTAPRTPQEHHLSELIRRRCRYWPSWWRNASKPNGSPCPPCAAKPKVSSAAWNAI